MKLEKAIESLVNDQRRNYTERETDLYKAQELGIEALKDLQEFDRIRGRSSRLPLPGETKD
ncbi:hypothetical protein ES708_15508 [subsurface metagenome]